MAQEPSQTTARPAWVETLWLGLLAYTAVCTLCMLGGIGGSQVRHYIGLLSDSPANAIAAVMAAGAARRCPAGATKNAWRFLALTLFLYLLGTMMAAGSWLLGRDPFPGPADVMFVAFYLALIASAMFLIRSSARRIPWLRLILDAGIFIIGFGAFFWYLVIHPADPAPGHMPLKQFLSQAYVALNCLCLLLLGVPLLSEDPTRSQRVPLLLLTGFGTMFLGDILWSLAKARGYYLPGDLQDVMYLACYVPLAAAGREQMRSLAEPQMVRRESVVLAHSLPYAAMLIAFLVLVYVTRGDIGGPAGVMTMVVFGLTLLLMVRQAVMLREDALTRERRAARAVEDRYASLIANASDVIMIVGAEGTLRFASPAAERTFGLKPEELAGLNLMELWAGSDAGKLGAFLSDVAASTQGVVGPVELRIQRGEHPGTLEIVGTNLQHDPAVNGLALTMRDVSERKALEEQLRQRAFHDPLTLLANRNLFRDRVHHALALARRDRPSVAVMFLDLDNFKNVNDSLGHEAGDRLLQAAAHRLVQSTRASDTVARLGGDEFAILLEGLQSQGEAEQVALALVDAMDAPFTLGSTEVRVSASIGAAFSDPGADAESLLSNADIAMYHAKAAGKNRFVNFQVQMQETLHERLRLESDMNKALANGEFLIEYQPVVDLGTRCLLGVEALLRWQHPEFGMLMPARFISIAEECGFIQKLGRWVLFNACRELRDWRGSIAGGSGLRISVNISGRHLQHGNLIQDVTDALRESQLEPGNMVIELTESTMMYNTDTNLARLRELQRMGVRLAIDDFGTGYSSLSYLHRFPIDILKIDRSFVSRLTNSDNGPELARAVIMLGETLGLDTVAEGIETEAQVAALLQLGCVAGQGFLFSKAVPLQQLSRSEFVARRNEYWAQQQGREEFSASGRFEALKRAGTRASTAG